ncbi:MAG: hypothetical protein ACM3ML_22030 [Micromonosporaceae bacterium]
MPRIAEQACPVTGGVDTHAGVHVAAVVDQVSRVLGTQAFAADAAGYRAALAALNGEASGMPKSHDGAAEAGPDAAGGPGWGGQGPHPGGQPAARPDPHRTRAGAPAAGRAVMPTAGGRGGPVPARQPGLPG